MNAGGDNNDDGSDIFWPGYVDATTNLILNLLFLLTILIVAVFMFALELGRATKVETNNPAENPTKPSETSITKAIDPAAENIALKTEIKRLNMLLAEKAAQEVESTGSTKSQEVIFNMPKPLEGLDDTKVYESEVVVRFKKDAVTLSTKEQEELKESLTQVVDSNSTSIFVAVPAGFSEAKRIGFYRVMSVRNLLIEMDYPSDKIDTSVVESEAGADSTIIRVRAY